MFQDRTCHKEKATVTSRELTQVQPLCVAKPLKRSKWKLVWRQVAAPLFGGSRPLTAGKGVQHQEKDTNLKSGAAGPLFGGSRTPATQKGAQQLESERLDHGTPSEQAAGHKANLLDPLLQDFGAKKVQKGAQQAFTKQKKRTKSLHQNSFLKRCKTPRTSLRDPKQIPKSSGTLFWGPQSLFVPTTTTKTTTTRTRVPWLLACTWGAKNIEICGVFCPEGFLRIGLTQPTWPLVGPCAQFRHHPQRNDSKHLSLDSFVSFFLRFCCGDAFCTGTFLQTDDVTHRNLYTEQFLCADTLTQRGLCTDKLLQSVAFKQSFLRKEVLHTEVFIYTDALHKGACTRINKGTQALLHTEPFTQRNHCTEQFLHKETFTQENFDTEKNVHTDCTKKFLHTETFAYRNFIRAAFTHRNFSAQKPLRTEVFMDSSFYTDPFTHRCLYTEQLLHTEASAHSTFLHTTNFDTGRLCYPFLITCSPSQVHHGFQEKHLQGGAP